MTPPMNRTATDTEAVLREALKRKTPLTLSYRNAAGWNSLKSRILEVDAANERFILEPPVDHNGRHNQQFTQDQYLGVAFRRGHKKCLCACVVTSTTDDAITLNWPDSIQTLQRRAYFRIPVPESMPTKVLIWPGMVADKPDNPGQDRSTTYANILDISLGGMAVSLPQHDDCPFKPGQTIGCEFHTPTNTTIAMEAHFKHAEQKPGGHMVLGFQFVGLEHGQEGRDRVRRLMDFTHNLAQQRRPHARRGLQRRRN